MLYVYEPTSRDMEELRQIRNDCRLFMTRDQTEITPERQAEWWERKCRGLERLFLFSNTQRNFAGYDFETDPKGTSIPHNVGYGRIFNAGGDSYWLLSGGLKSEFRGKGLGKELFAYLTRYVEDMFNGVPVLEVLASNERAIHVYLDLGYQIKTTVAGAFGSVYIMSKL